MPLPEPTVATIILLLLHVPSLTASVSVVVLPTHIVFVPEMIDGEGFTVTVMVL